MIKIDKESFGPFRQALILLDMVPGPRWEVECTITGMTAKHYDRRRAVQRLRELHMQAVMDCDSWLHDNRELSVFPSSTTCSESVSSSSDPA